ncbi:MAG: biotin/lipoyl-binding protein [candidate division Zixibacteria bacterium]|nr:biotin/lipoyl-binding protein [candidate division Zixibacteria bacterium]
MMTYYVEIEGKELAINVAREGDKYIIQNDEHDTSVDLFKVGDGFYSLIMEGKQYDLYISNKDGSPLIDTGQRAFSARVMNDREKAITKFAAEAAVGGALPDLKAPMPGLVVKVLVEAGREVKKGDGLVIVEAMKMENELKSAGEGTVKEIKVNAGQAVDKDAVLVTFE